MEAYGLPNALRMTIGSEEANEATIAALGAFLRKKPADERARLPAPGADRHRPDRLVDRACRAAGQPRAPHRHFDAQRRDARAAPRNSASATAITPTRPRPCAMPIASSCAFRSAPPAPSPGPIAGALKPGAIVSDVGSVKASVIAAGAAASSEGRPFRAGASRRRHGIFRARRRLRRALRQPLVHPDAAAGDRPASGREAARFLAAAGRQCRDDGRRAPRPGARHHQPRAASHRLQHRRHRRRSRDGDPVGGDEVLRRRLPRFHPHRRLRPDHVARRLPQQPRGGAGDARPLHRGPDGAAAAHPLRRGRQAVRAVHPHPRHPPRHHRRRPGNRGRRLRPSARQGRGARRSRANPQKRIAGIPPTGKMPTNTSRCG